VRVGVFDRIANADRAVHELVAAGFPKERITVICPDCDPHDYHEYRRRDPAGAHAPAAASTGGAIGALLGGWVPLVGIAATGGVGLLAAGTLLAGAAGGAIAGGFIGAMVSRGFESEMTNFYDRAQASENGSTHFPLPRLPAPRPTRRALRAPSATGRVCGEARNSAQGSRPFGALDPPPCSTRKVDGSARDRSAFHDTGVEIGAPARARTE
jgi:predicted lipid-binding transport protein (Tim44 family)